MDLAVLVALDDAGIFQIDQIFLLQRACLVQHFVGGVDTVKAKYDQTAHIPLLCGDSISLKAPRRRTLWQQHSQPFGPVIQTRAPNSRLKMRIEGTAAPTLTWIKCRPSL